MEGNIVVDGVLASCYAFSDHDMIHIGMIPIRWFPELVDLIFGENYGFHEYVKFLQDFGKWLLPYSST